MNINHPFNMGVYGVSKSGKSYLIKNLISNIYDQFDCIIVITCSSGNYNYLKKYKKFGVKSKELNAIDIVDKIKIILKKQVKHKENKRDNKVLIVFDDIAGLIPKKSDILINLNCAYRHYNCSLLFSYQMITDCDTSIRKNHEMVCIFKTVNQTEVSNFRTAFLSNIGDIHAVRDYLENGFDRKYKFLFVHIPTGERYFAICD